MAIFLSFFICIREPSVCDVVCIRKREHSGNETLGMSVCVWRPLFVSGVIGGFRGGAEGAAAPLFFLYFQSVFETLTLLYFASRIRLQCCMLHVLKSEVFIRGWGTRPPLSEFSGSAPGCCQLANFSTCFLGAINLPGKKNSCSLLKLFFFILLSELSWL